MLRLLSLRNFQIHRKFSIEFAPVTTIVGRSDVGKTALLRALRWLFFSRPQGTHFVRHGEKGCAVRVLIDDVEIIRRRTKSKNSYELNGRLYQAIKADVPEDISKAVNVGSGNLQQQHDASFWLSLSPGQVSKELNKIVDLGVIDSSLQRINAKCRKSKAAVEVVQDRLQEAEQQLEELAWVTQAAESWRVVCDLASHANEKRAVVASLAALIQDAAKYTEKVGSTRDAATSGLSVLAKAEKAEAFAKKCGTLADLCGAIRDTQHKIKFTLAGLEQVRQELAQVEECPLCGSPLSGENCV